MDNNLKIVNPQLEFHKVSLSEPSKNFYLLIAAAIDHSPFPFFLITSSKKKNLIRKAKGWCKELLKETEVISAVVFKASIIPPGKGKFLQERPGVVQIANYDFVVLIETTSLEKIEIIRNSQNYKTIETSVKAISTATQIIAAKNVKQINTVNHKKQGVFLFNYFFANNLQQNLGIWEYTAGWFQQETGLNNSTVLMPIKPEESNYTIINHCRWDRMSDILPALLFKKSFHTYVLDNFYANDVAAMPILYKIA